MRHLTPILLVCLVAALLGTPARAIGGQNTPAADAKASGPVVNINTATAAQLEALPGIGPRTAALIVEYRQKNGQFKKVEELMNVKGIGEKTFLKLKAQLTVGSPAAAGPTR